MYPRGNHTTQVKKGDPVNWTITLWWANARSLVALTGIRLVEDILTLRFSLYDGPFSAFCIGVQANLVRTIQQLHLSADTDPIEFRKSLAQNPGNPLTTMVHWRLSAGKLAETLFIERGTDGVYFRRLNTYMYVCTSPVAHGKPSPPGLCGIAACQTGSRWCPADMMSQTCLQAPSWPALSWWHWLGNAWRTTRHRWTLHCSIYIRPINAMAVFALKSRQSCRLSWNSDCCEVGSFISDSLSSSRGRDSRTG